MAGVSGAHSAAKSVPAVVQTASAPSPAVESPPAPLLPPVPSAAIERGRCVLPLPAGATGVNVRTRLESLSRPEQPMTFCNADEARAYAMATTGAQGALPPLQAIVAVAQRRPRLDDDVIASLFELGIRREALDRVASNRARLDEPLDYAALQKELAYDWKITAEIARGLRTGDTTREKLDALRGLQSAFRDAHPFVATLQTLGDPNVDASSDIALAESHAQSVAAGRISEAHIAAFLQPRLAEVPAALDTLQAKLEDGTYPLGTLDVVAKDVAEAFGGGRAVETWLSRRALADDVFAAGRTTVEVGLSVASFFLPPSRALYAARAGVAVGAAGAAHDVIVAMQTRTAVDAGAGGAALTTAEDAYWSAWFSAACVGADVLTLAKLRHLDPRLGDALRAGDPEAIALERHVIALFAQQAERQAQIMTRAQALVGDLRPHEALAAARIEAKTGRPVRSAQTYLVERNQWRRGDKWKEPGFDIVLGEGKDAMPIELKGGVWYTPGRTDEVAIAREIPVKMQETAVQAAAITSEHKGLLYIDLSALDPVRVEEFKELFLAARAKFPEATRIPIARVHYLTQ